MTGWTIYPSVSIASLMYPVWSCCCLLPPQEVKGWWILGEQQHLLGAEEGAWLQSHRVSYTVVTPELQITHTHFNPLSLYFDPGWFWWRTIHIHIAYSLFLQFIKVIALIASPYLICVNIFMQAYYENVDQFWHFCAHISTCFVVLNLLN